MTADEEEDELAYRVGWYEDGSLGRFGTPEAFVADRELAHHAVLFGDTGTGKTRLLTHLLAVQLEQGHSLVYLNPKETSIHTLLGICETIGIAPEQVHVVSPAFPEAVPGWNPLRSNLPMGQAVSKLADMARTLIGDWGSRLDSIFKAGLVILGTHGYTIGELSRLLTDDAFRESLMAKPGQSRSYDSAVAYFQVQFPGAVKADKNAIPAVLNKVEKLLESDFLAELLTAPANTINLGTFFDRQQVVLFHLDESTLFTSGVSLLAGLITQEMFFLASRPPGRQQVILALDEIGIMKTYVEEPLAKIARLSRESGLRLLVSGQEISVLSGTLETVFKQAAVRLFLRLNHDDADSAAKVLRGSVLPHPDEIEELVYEDEYDAAVAEWNKQFTPAAWSSILQDLDVEPNGPGEVLLSIKGIDPVIVRAPRVGEFGPTRRYLSRLPRRPEPVKSSPGTPPVTAEAPPPEGVFELEDDDTF